MTNLASDYTPLEALLLFQALRSDTAGLANASGSPSIFNTISDQLHQIPLVCNDPTYDPNRLSADALRELYLGLLKEEVKRDLERADDANPDAQSPPRKRKAPSPGLPTVQEASQHRHLIPQLVARLYLRYRENVVKELREHESRFDAVPREIAEIATGSWDERLYKQLQGPATGRPAWAIQNDRYHSQQAANSSVSGRASYGGNGNVPGRAQSNVSPTPNHIRAIVSQSGPPAAPNTQRHGTVLSSNGIVTKLPSTTPVDTTSGLRQTRQPTLAEHGSTLPISHPSTPVQHHGPHAQTNSHTQTSTLLPVASPNLVSSVQPPVVSPANRQVPVPTVNQQPYIPQPSNQPGPYPSNDDRALQQGRSPVPLSAAHPLQHSSLPTTLPSPQNKSRQDHIGTSQQQPAPPGIHRQDTEGPRTAQAIQQSQSSLPQQSPIPMHPRYPPSAPVTVKRPTPSANDTLMSQIVSALATPVRRPRTPVWKSESRSSQLKPGNSLPQPGIEPLSPVQTRAELVPQLSRFTRGRDAEHAEQPPEPETVEKPRRRGRPKRERSTHSIGSSTAEPPSRITRSQSVGTTAGLLPNSDDRPVSRGTVKAEPSTPAAMIDDNDTVREGSATPADPRTKRKRRETASSQAQPPVKRSRRLQDTTEPTESTPEAADSPDNRSNIVTAYRNFSKLSATIMNDINSHKHASYFANLVRDKDAPGYGEIIMRPQHLKSIRAAITAGTRAVAAAAQEMSPTSPANEGSSATLELERTDDVVPPKAIVNGAQLEKEVMRMLANAVMFNPGDDGMVRDTREMFDDVEAQIRHWRGADRDTAEPAPGMTPGGPVEDVEESKSKRRKG